MENIREAEARDRNPRYYARNPQPNYRSFGRPDFMDETGRLYRLPENIAPLPAAGRPVVRLDVKLPRGVPWFKGPNNVVTLYPLSEGRAREWTVHDVLVVNQYLEYGHRTGYIHIPARDAWW